MDVLKAVFVKYGKELSKWLTATQRNGLLYILREAFLYGSNSQDAEYQRRKDLLLLIELLAGSFQLNDSARQFYFHSD